MKIRPRFILVLAMTALGIFAMPIVWSAFSTHSYFREGRCVCGYEMFVRIQGDRLLHYSPGHGYPEEPRFKLRPKGDGWEVIGLPQPDLNGNLTDPGDKVIGHLRIHHGALYESWGENANRWTRLPRAYNPWPIWYAKYLHPYPFSVKGVGS